RVCEFSSIKCQTKGRLEFRDNGLYNRAPENFRRTRLGIGCELRQPVSRLDCEFACILATKLRVQWYPVDHRLTEREAMRGLSRAQHMWNTAQTARPQGMRCNKCRCLFLEQTGRLWHPWPF